MHLVAELGLAVRAGENLALQADVGDLDPGARVRATVEVDGDRHVQGGVQIGQPLLELVDELLLLGQSLMLPPGLEAGGSGRGQGRCHQGGGCVGI